MGSEMEPQSWTQLFEQHRAHLQALAYRLLGSVSESEDVLQDAYLRLQARPADNLEEPRAYLSKVVTRLCLDALTSARARRESYVGPWLPEPVLGDGALGVTLPKPPVTPEANSERLADISVSLMLVLERLSPLERAALLLHDVFDVDYREVASTLGRTEDACRQLVKRARQHVRAERPRFAPTSEQGERLVQSFLRAVSSGDVEGLSNMLAEDAKYISDGGGLASAATKPIVGRDNVARFVLALARKFPLPADSLIRYSAINGMPGLVLVAGGRVHSTLTFGISGAVIAAVYNVRNPHKLKHVLPQLGSD